MSQPRAVRPNRAALIVNPLKCKTIDVRQIVSTACTGEGWAESLFLETTADSPGVAQTRHALSEGVDLVIAAGGDGTVRCVAQALQNTGTALGLIPLGTGNLLARNLGLNISNPGAAAREALRGSDHPIDVIGAILDQDKAQQLFVVMAGLGFDAAVMADTNVNLKESLGWLAYIEAGIRKLPGRPVKASISIDGGPASAHRLRGIMSGNCGKLQGGVEIFPGARFDDGSFDLMTLAPSGTFGWMGVLAGLLSRGRSKDPSIQYFRGKKAEISLAKPQALQLDGDPLGDVSHVILTIDAGALLVRKFWP
ncbi:diacylglycerol kinase [Arthrobacter sp. ERGS1:01]|uniref:diacylglycerol/lipid kinase family protein n=1 Tax=Arthrobacter sp. ERGS1:01 TaxID=1704044 RepID=UPI0006B4A32B|nr:diacylglycerol kinase family protein [Arthrobacter sp. ERGS1:01]ALE06231.1 diacylglycerol kinase [Arthrobacter sp. ERGS1:01]